MTYFRSQSDSFRIMSSKQRTIKSAVHLTGVGLHTGAPVNLSILPAPENHGYRFQRIDLPEQPIIKADPDLVVATQRGTTLEQNGARVYTTEHVLSAIYGCKIDNMNVKFNSDADYLMFVLKWS